jgi:selenocysteine lyase/cysteine desulfurase
MYQHLFSKFMVANKGKQHFAAHSHHYWPDVCLDAMHAYWQDTASFVDNKWDTVLGEKIPQLQQHIAKTIGVNHPQQIAFASNTHELVFRLLSSFNFSAPLRILTTDSEFYSFDRQANRLAELPNIEVVKIAAQPYATFNQRFEAAANANDFDFIYFSQVFFNSGVVVENVNELITQLHKPNRIVVVDGYHAFMALPFSLHDVQDKVFYVSGGYKYAMAGEGCCFMYCPVDNGLRPLYTGWYAAFDSLSNKTNEVGYAADGYRFAGSTMDYTTMYRQLAVYEMLQANNISVQTIHAHVQACQQKFLGLIDEMHHPLINRQNLILEDINHHGHFLTFELPDLQSCQALQKHLHANGIETDSRQNRIRFGFGLYHTGDYDLQALQRFV